MKKKKVDYLRISITNKCNLDCKYCHKEGNRNSSELPLKQYKKIVSAARKLGFKKLKITGGEPLLHESVFGMIKFAKKQRYKDISIVTNGCFLEKNAKKLAKAGLDRINIGCDFINKRNFCKNAERIKEGLNAAKKAGISEIKLNMVVQNGINNHLIEDMIAFAKKNKVALQLIELMPKDLRKEDRFFKKHYFSLEKIEKEIAKKSKRMIERKMQGRRKYIYKGAAIEIVGPHRKEFCENCTKLRINNEGKIKSCLRRNDNLIEFKNIGSLRKAIDGKGNSLYNPLK